MVVWIVFLWTQCLVVIAQVTVISTNTSLPAGCYESNYSTSFTKCQLNFLSCYSQRILKSCVLWKCDRYIRGGDCYLQSGYILDKTNCLATCCGDGSKQFDEKSCNLYNVNAEKSQKATETAIIIVLVLVGVGLLALVVWFCVRKLQCLQKTEPFRVIKYNIKWRKDEYQQVKCDICRTYGPLMVTPCEHKFHISCFQEATKLMSCPKCKQPIKDRIKFYCFTCRQKSFKVRLYRVEDITEAIAEGKALHYELCPKEIKCHRHLIESEQQL